MRALLVGAAMLTACGDDDAVCSNLLDAGASGVTIAVAAQTFTFGNFISSMARDCGMESVSIEGVQLEPTPTSTFRISLCFPDRGRVGADPIPLTEVMNFFAAAQSPTEPCAFSYDQAQAATGTVTLSGFCSQGGGPFSMTYDATLPGTSSCSPDPVTLQLSGSVSVSGF